MKYTQSNLKKYLDKLRKKAGRFNLSLRYYRDTKNLKEFNNVNKVLKKFDSKNVLDVGCHIGYYAIKISEFSNKVVGIDIDEEIIKKANKFKEISKAKNFHPILYSAFDLDDEFMETNGINAVFIHKTVGDFDSKDEFKWKKTDFIRVFSLFAKYCDIVVCNDTEIIKDFFSKKGFTISKKHSFKHNYLYIIQKDNG